MELLWAAEEPMTVAAVHKALQDERDLAYTTVMTVLDRLAKKKLVRRTLVGRAWEYLPALTQEELVASELIAALNACPPDVQRGVLTRFRAGLTEVQAAGLGS